MIYFGFVISVLALLSSLWQIVDARRTKNSSATWGWVVASVYILSDILDLGAKIFGQ